MLNIGYPDEQGHETVRTWEMQGNLKGIPYRTHKLSQNVFNREILPFQ